MERTYEREAKTAALMAHELNVFGFSKKAFAREMSKEHRYLQSEFMELIIAFVEYAASDDYGFDGRNEWVHRVARDMVKVLP